MNWVGWVIVISAVVLIRMVLRRWILIRWLSDDLSGTQAKLGLFAATFGPMFAAGLVIAIAMPFPRNLLFFALFCLALAPAVGLGAAMFDYATKYGVKSKLRRQGRL